MAGVLGLRRAMGVCCALSAALFNGCSARYIEPGDGSTAIDATALMDGPRNDTTMVIVVDGSASDATVTSDPVPIPLDGEALMDASAPSDVPADIAAPLPDAMAVDDASAPDVVAIDDASAADGMVADAASAPDGMAVDDASASEDSAAVMDGAVEDAVAMDAMVSDAASTDAASADAESADTASADAASAEASVARDAIAADGDAAVLVSPTDYCDKLTDRTPVTMFMASDDSNSVASAEIVRGLITTGVRVPAEVVRTHEFMNYYNPRFAPAPAGTVRLQAALRSTPGSGSMALQVAAQSEARTLAQVRPMSLTFVIDNSASMTFERMNRARAAIRAISHQLRNGDRVSAVTWNTTTTTLLDNITVAGPDDRRIEAMAAALVASWDATDLGSGLRAGYSLANRHRTVGTLNRVVLISDGEANVGATEAGLIAAPARDEINGEVHLVGVSVGDGINDTLMDRVTDLGRGASVFIDRPEEASVVFGTRFVETMDVAVRAVRLELELPWYMRVVATSAESIAGTAELVEPQYLSPNDAMVFQQVVQACSATIAQPSDPIRLRATFRDRDTSAPREVSVDSTIGALWLAAEGPLRKGEAVVAYAEAIKIADLGSRATALAAIDRALTVVARARTVADDSDLREIEALLTRYRDVRRLL